ncbi:MAG: hypothetical protein ACRD12_01595, partial [Acidimicrobiales bacterium]
MFLLAVCAGRPDDAPVLLAELLRRSDAIETLDKVPVAVPLLDRLGDAGRTWASVPVSAYLPFVEDVKRFSFVLEEI